MKSHITMLVGDKSSTKHYIIDKESDIAQKGRVEMAYEHESYTLPVENIDDLFAMIKIVRNTENSYIIRGLGQKEYQTKVRRTLYLDDAENELNFMEVGSSWICCDFDNYEVPDNINRTSKEAIEYLIENHLPKQFMDVSYVFQWSASAGLEYKLQQIKPGTSVHLFFYLDTLLTNEKMKVWFSKRIEEGFDRSTFNTITPIFVNTKIIKDPRIIDIIPEEDKFGLVRKESNIIKVPIIKICPKKPITACQTISIDNQNKILQELNIVGAIFKKGQGYFKLWHPMEGSRGDWFVYTKNLQLVHHHVKKSMRIDKWLKQFWNVSIELDVYEICSKKINNNEI